ncbi:cytochrome P450 6k1-like isoform X2 [Phymastichus coffea]|uniref:cytochrome P450 6k1-like isoform X2 n=1 Tax=Phymastichus coffea TaxID=108790 RepID=UPI00273C22D9|nr:cytochrome P450 6k1-like isoform X2 [Phymastichus coffea]
MAIVTTDWTQDLFLCVILLFLGFYLYLTRNFNYWKKLGVKELTPSIFFGNLGPCILARKPPLDFLQEAYQAGEGERLLGFYAIDQPYLIVRDPEFIRHIFVKDFHNFSNKMLSTNENDVLGKNSLFLVKNPPWQHIRQKLTPIFTSGKLKKMFDLMLEICEDFQIYCDNLKIDDKIGKPVEVKEACANLTTDIIGITAFGLKLNSLINPNAEFRSHGRAMFRSSYVRYLQMLAIFFVPALRRYTNPKFFDDKGSEFLKNTFWYVINERVKTGNKRNDLIDLLIEIRKNQENNNSDTYKLEGDALVAQAAIFFTGGFETSSTTMSYALYELARNPDMQNRLRKDIFTAMEKEGGKITYDWVSTLPYLNMVVQEILRLYPVLAWLDRLPENDYTFPGTDITVKKNTPFILPMRALHMDANYFPNPEKFDPERFSNENKNNIVPFTYFPFGQGPRNCIGERLGLLQTKLGLVNFITRQADCSN